MEYMNHFLEKKTMATTNLSNLAAQCSRLPAVSEARSGLEEATKQLRNAVDKMPDRLASVLRDPQPEPTCQTAPPQNGACELAVWMNSIADEITNVVVKLNDLRDRLEI
jgi:hypothetical protein